MPDIRVTATFFLFISLLCHPQLGRQAKQDKSSDQGEPSFRFEEYTITRIHQGYEDDEFTVSELVSAYLQRIESIDRQGPELNAFITVNPDAMKIAKSLEDEWASGSIRSPMHGVPVVLKDNIDTRDKMPTTAGSRALGQAYPARDSWVAARLREAGAVILGKANLSEWANFRASYSSSGWSAVGGQTKNPYDLSRNPCGSSSGSAVAVSANLCVVAIGTETNGSIMCPSNANGIVGIKPTVGLISRTGIVPISCTQDTPGPMGRTVRDVAICLGALTGVDSSDAKTLESEGRSYDDYQQFLNEDGLKGKRIGVYTEPLGKHTKVALLMTEAVKFIESSGAVVIEIDKITHKSVRHLSFEVMLYEFKDGINRYLENQGGDVPVTNLTELIAFNVSDTLELKYFDQKIFEMADRRGSLDSPGYKESLADMLRYSRQEGIDRVMDEYQLDAIAAPTGGPAWEINFDKGDDAVIGSSSPAATAGYPNISVPMGSIDGLPVGISFFGRAWSEPGLLEIAYAFENGTRHRKVPQFMP